MSLKQGIADASHRSDLISDICSILNHIADQDLSEVYINIDKDGMQYSISRTENGKTYTEEYDSRAENTGQEEADE